MMKTWKQKGASLVDLSRLPLSSSPLSGPAGIDKIVRISRPIERANESREFPLPTTLPPESGRGDVESYVRRGVLQFIATHQWGRAKGSSTAPLSLAFGSTVRLGFHMAKRF